MPAGRGQLTSAVAEGGGMRRMRRVERRGVLEKSVDMELVMRTVDELLAGNCA